jgi:citrate synthase
MIADSDPNRAWVTAAEAARELNVSRATLYAYVSRGLLTSRAQAGTRKRLYAVGDIARLRAAREPDARSADARAALAFGMPVLDSAITQIHDGRFYYRGRDALSLAEAASVETVAGLLWGDGDSMTPIVLSAVGLTRTTPATLSGAIEALAIAERSDPAAHARTSAAIDTVSGRILAILVGTWCRAPLPQGASIAASLAEAWIVLGKERGAEDAIRRALICCADHELNASAFAVRVAASTGASPYAALIAGLATLSGPRHGGQTPKTLAMLLDAVRVGNGKDPVAERLRQGDEPPGFGHPLYANGDPRAQAILEALRDCPRPILDVADAGTAALGLRPNLDFGLAAIAATYGLSADQAIGLFAIGRSIGWLSHFREQSRVDTVIRPRARYTGPDPRPAHRQRARD